ncbi:hypothetical protein V5P93_004264 [Actinokineospora auranticolor]|uniref:COG1470 family protein n=1 Tax=Actinokineospora auranticolor TaxID=155976 RepID=UPI0035A8309E
MNALVRVTVAPDRLALAPGESADVVVTIQNAGPVVEHFTTTVVGLPRDDLFTVEPATVKLRPKETGTTQVRITVPPRGLLVAGPYVLGILVRSPYQRDASYCAELPLAVAPVPVLAMAVQPEVVLGGDRGAYTVALSNEGNTTLAVALTGSDPERRVGFEFDPERVLLEPGTGSGVAVRVRANAPFTGQEVRRALTLRAHAGELESERPATFVQRPRLAGGLVRVAGIAAGIAALAGAAVGGALLIRDNKTEQVAQLLPTPPAIPTALPQPSSPPSLPSSLPPSSVPSPSSLPPPLPLPPLPPPPNPPANRPSPTSADSPTTNRQATA